LPINDYIAFAHQLADAAAEAIAPYIGQHGAVETKGDASPVTAADIAAEAAMRALIEATYPDHGIYGEEFGQSNMDTMRSAEAARAAKRQGSAEGEGGVSPPSKNNYIWVLDPIDGTRAFIAGLTEWGTLVALCEDGIPILGILNQPVTGERWVGAHGQPSTLNGAIIRTRACDTLSAASISTTSKPYFTPEQAAHYQRIASRCGQEYENGDCYAYGMLARGERDLVLDAGLKPYDILALVPIIEGAGGVVLGYNGPVTLSNYSTACALGDARLLQLLPP
jgi:inositol-phosphate phosphatase/L-galactose 1-phosphate phosphatase/histidinol-phosphatase